LFGTLGGPEILLILFIALIVFGPRKLPEIGKSLGKMMVEFRRASNDFRRTIEEEVEADKLRQSLDVSRLEAPKAEPAAQPAATAPAPGAPEAAPDATAAPQTPEAPGPEAGEAPPAGTVAQGTWPPPAEAATPAPIEAPSGRPPDPS
jgi:sec-independent protein translocase protein TatB